MCAGGGALQAYAAAEKGYPRALNAQLWLVAGGWGLGAGGGGAGRRGGGAEGRQRAKRIKRGSVAARQCQEGSGSRNCCSISPCHLTAAELL